MVHYIYKGFFQERPVRSCQSGRAWRSSRGRPSMERSRTDWHQSRTSLSGKPSSSLLRQINSLQRSRSSMSSGSSTSSSLTRSTLRTLEYTVPTATWTTIWDSHASMLGSTRSQKRDIIVLYAQAVMLHSSALLHRSMVVRPSRTGTRLSTSVQSKRTDQQTIDGEPIRLHTLTMVQLKVHKLQWNLHSRNAQQQQWCMV